MSDDRPMTEPRDPSTEVHPANAAPPTVWASQNYADANAAIEFLTEVLGFEATLIVEDPDDPSIIHHAELWWPEGGGFMLGTSQRNDSEFSTLNGNIGMYVVTADPLAVYERCVAAGARIEREMESTDYCAAQFTVADPEGNMWCFGTYRGLRQPGSEGARMSYGE